MLFDVIRKTKIKFKIINRSGHHDSEFAAPHHIYSGRYPVLIHSACPMSQFCRGKMKSGDPCDCEEYSPPDNPDPSKAVLCQECLHGKSKHPRDNTSIRTPAEPENIKKSVLELFTAKAGGRQDVVQKGNVAREDARRETLSGFRDNTKGKQASGSKQKVIQRFNGRQLDTDHCCCLRN
jgi:hypothetical protein